MAEATSGIGAFLGGSVEAPERRSGNDWFVYVGIAAVAFVVLLLATRK